MDSSGCWAPHTTTSACPAASKATTPSRPLSGRDLQALRAKLSYLSEPHRDVELAFWSRGDADVFAHGEAAVRLFTCADMV